MKNCTENQQQNQKSKKLCCLLKKKGEFVYFFSKPFFEKLSKMLMSIFLVLKGKQRFLFAWVSCSRLYRYIFQENATYWQPGKPDEVNWRWWRQLATFFNFLCVSIWNATIVSGKVIKIHDLILLLVHYIMYCTRILQTMLI